MTTINVEFKEALLPYTTNTEILRVFGNKEGGKALWNHLTDFQNPKNQEYGFNQLGGQFAYEALLEFDEDFDVAVDLAKKIDTTKITTEELLKTLTEMVDKLYNSGSVKPASISDHTAAALLTWSILNEYSEEEKEQLKVEHVWNMRYRGYSFCKRYNTWADVKNKQKGSLSALVFTDKDDNTSINTTNYETLRQESYDFIHNDSRDTLFQDFLMYEGDDNKFPIENFVKILRETINNILNQD